MDPSNFVASIVLALEIFTLTNCLQNASWIINSLKVYKAATLSGGSSSSASRRAVHLLPTLQIVAALVTMHVLLSLL